MLILKLYLNYDYFKNLLIIMLNLKKNNNNGTQKKNGFNWFKNSHVNYLNYSNFHLIFKFLS